MKKIDVNGQINLFSIMDTRREDTSDMRENAGVADLGEKQLDDKCSSEPKGFGEQIPTNQPNRSSSLSEKSCYLENDILEKLCQEVADGAVLHLGNIMRRFHLSATEAEAYLNAVPQNKSREKKSWIQKTEPGSDFTGEL